MDIMKALLPRVRSAIMSCDHDADIDQFEVELERKLNREQRRLIDRGMSPERSHIHIAAAWLIAARPAMRNEASARRIPLEMIEREAVRDAAWDAVEMYAVNYTAVANMIARLVARA